MISEAIAKEKEEVTKDTLLLLNKKLIMQAKHYGYRGVLETTLHQIEEELFKETGETIVVPNDSLLIP